MKSKPWAFELDIHLSDIVNMSSWSPDVLRIQLLLKNPRFDVHGQVLVWSKNAKNKNVLNPNVVTRTTSFSTNNLYELTRHV